jgi:hypothetical protein
MLKNFPAVFRFILRALAKDRLSSAHPAVAVSSLKLFEISPAGLYAAARTVCVGQILLHRVTGYF